MHKHRNKKYYILKCAIRKPVSSDRGQPFLHLIRYLIPIIPPTAMSATPKPASISNKADKNTREYSSPATKDIISPKMNRYLVSALSFPLIPYISKVKIAVISAGRRKNPKS